jgi:hypothetical protein
MKITVTYLEGENIKTTEHQTTNPPALPPGTGVVIVPGQPETLYPLGKVVKIEIDNAGLVPGNMKLVK